MVKSQWNQVIFVIEKIPMNLLMCSEYLVLFSGQEFPCLMIRAMRPWVGKFRAIIPAADLFRECVYWLNLFKKCPMLGPPDMCLITSRNVKQTSTWTKTAKPSTNCNEPFRICFLLGNTSASGEGKIGYLRVTGVPAPSPRLVCWVSPTNSRVAQTSCYVRPVTPQRGAQELMYEPRLVTRRIQKLLLQGPPIRDCVCPHPASFYMESCTHPNPYLHKGSLFFRRLLLPSLHWA